MMRCRWKWLGLGCLALSGILGCATPNPKANLREKYKEQYNVPPENDARYDKPPDLSEYINKHNTKNPFEKEDFQQLGQPGGGTPGGMSGGMGAPGMGAPGAPH